MKTLVLAGKELEIILSMELAIPAVERAFAAPEVLDAQDRFTGDYLIALEELEAPRVLFTVVGDAGGETSALWAAALRVYDPLKVMEIPVEGEYADVPGPAVLVCDGGTLA